MAAVAIVVTTLNEKEKEKKKDAGMPAWDIKHYASEFDIDYLVKIPKLVLPIATMVPMGFCWFCNKSDVTEGDSIESSVYIQEYWRVVRHCKDNAKCIKAAKASLAVWCAGYAKRVSYKTCFAGKCQNHPMLKTGLNVLRTSGSVESDWIATEFAIQTRDISENDFVELKKLVKKEVGHTVGLSLDKSGLSKTLPMWTIFYLNPALKPSDVVPTWPDYFPPNVFYDCLEAIDKAYVKAKQIRVSS
jgi:hypothetical protein